MHVLILIISALLTLKEATAACNLCFDGEAITKPEYALDLTSPVPIKTCQDLVNLLVFIPEDDDLCFAARAVSTLCGCPNLPPNACTICGGNMTRPLQNLDGLVNLGDNIDFFGLSPTCALVESGINPLNEDDQDCSKLPMDELQNYCGCLVNEDEGEDDNTCTLCPGGEIVSGNDLQFITLSLNAYEYEVTCAIAQELVKGEESGSVLCNDIQIGATACGCPVRENACQLCPAVLDNNFVHSSIFGTRQPCRSFFYQLQSFDRDSVECQSLDDSYREACECNEEEEFVPCTLCPGGEAVSYPDKVIVGIEGLGFDQLEPRCGTLDQAAAFVSEKDPACSSARVIAKMCGCNVPETACSICESGNSLSNPFHEYEWAFGTITDSFPELFEPIDLNEREFRCELADSFLSAAYDNGDDFCYFNQLIRGTACGCGGSNSTKVGALVWTQRCSGILSLMGSLAIIVFVLTKKAKNRWNTYNQIVLAISMFDALSSMAYIFGTALTPAALGLYGSIGNEGTCTFQGWLFQMGITSVYYNVVLCVYFIFVVKYDWTERKFKKVRRWVHLGVLVVGIAMSMAVIPFVTADWRWCYLNKPPYSESWLPGMFFFILPIGICMLGMTVLMAVFVKYVHQVESKTKTRKLSGTGPKRQSLANRTFWQSLYFLAVFYIVWPIQFVAFIIPLVENNYWVYLLAAIVGPLQGFLNAMVVFYRDRKAAWERMLMLLGINYIKERWSSAFQTSGGTAKGSSSSPSTYITPLCSQEHPDQVTEKGQPASPYLVETNEDYDKLVANLDRDSNLDRQIDTLGKRAGQQKVEDISAASPRDIDTSMGIDAVFEGSEKPQDYCADDVANEWRRAPDRCSGMYESHAILEFAMNAGLLDDDEYARYQDSIKCREEDA